MAYALGDYSSAYILLSAVAVFSYVLLLGRKVKKLPPGPPGKFLAGNTYQISRTEPWITYMSWGKTYGPLISFRVFNQRTIVISSAKVVADLMESRSNIYADRPVAIMTGELAGRKETIFHISFFSPKFKTYRKLLHSALNPRAVKDYESILQKETKTLLNNLLSAPENFAMHVRRQTSAVIVKLIYGYQIEKEEDEFVMLVPNALRLIGSIAVPGKYLVEFMPFLRFIPAWFPGAGFKRLAKEIGKKAALIENAPFQWAKSQIKSGRYSPSFTSKNLLSDNVDSFSTAEQEDIVMWCGEGLYAGGADTTVSILTTFFLVMALHPNIQKQAQAEVDEVVSGRLPAFDDCKSMPYVRALIKELNRWAPVAPLGLAHRVSKDDHYEGYLIPKGTKIVANIWALTHDEESYPNPSVFDPERHLGDNPQIDPFKFIFGFGRRSCPGSHFAEMSLSLTISNILATYNIAKPLDQNGREIEPSIEWVAGATRLLKPFACRITPRSKDAISLFHN